MIGFWFVAVIFILIALGFILPPLLKKREVVAVDRKALTVSIYQDQMDELDNDLKNGVISDEQYTQAKTDIERNLLDDVQRLEQAEAAPSKVSQAKVPAIAVGVFVPVLAVVLYGMWGAGEPGLNPEAATPQVQAGEHEQTIEGMVAQLEQRMMENPEDGEGWFMLARSYKFMRRYDDAIAAFEKTMPLGGAQIPDVLAGYADTVAMANDRQLVPKSIQLLEQALALDPNHVQSLWLVGTAAYQDANYEKALGYWQRLSKVLPAGSEDQKQINANIAEVRSLLGMPVSPAMAPAPAASGGATLMGTVSLGGAIAGKANPDDTVFIFARAAEGPRMPLAIVRTQVRNLPYDFILDDSMAMNPAMKLSGFARVVVGARISETGNAMPQSGDLEGYSKEIRVGTTDKVPVLINSVVP